MDEEKIALPTDPPAEEVSVPIESNPPTVTETSVPIEPQPDLNPTPSTPSSVTLPESSTRDTIPEPEPVSSPIPVILPNVPTPIPDPDVNPSPEPTPIPNPSFVIPISKPTPEPQLSDTKPQISAADFVASLSDEQLKAAAALYTKRNQAEISRKGVAKRKEIMELNLREIIDYLSRNNGSPLPRIAKNTGIKLGTTSKYLRQLIASDKVRADG
jgi:hypothetical protein